MTKDQLKLIAEVFAREVKDYGYNSSVGALAHGVALVLALGHPKFDFNKFIEACGVTKAL